MLNTLSAQSNGVLATMQASRSDDVAQFEDRLRSAGINYEMKTLPIWSNNAYYLSMLVQPTRSTAGKPVRPSSHRVQQEMDKIHHPMVDVTKVEIDGDAYIATLNILGQVTTEHIIARLQANSTLFSNIETLSDTPRADTPNLRVAQLRLHLR